MESLPAELHLKILCLLDHKNLATAQLVCRKWKVLASQDSLWSNLFKEKWGEDRASFYAPSNSESWKDVYEVQNRCDRVGLGLRIVREGWNYYLVHQGKIQRYLGSREQEEEEEAAAAATINTPSPPSNLTGGGILDKIFFFIGDLEAAEADAKRGRVL